MANALSHIPTVNAVSIAAQNDLSYTIDEFSIDSNFKDIMLAIALGKIEEPFHVKDCYLL